MPGRKTWASQWNWWHLWEEEKGEKKKKKWRKKRKKEGGQTHTHKLLSSVWARNGGREGRVRNNTVNTKASEGGVLLQAAEQAFPCSLQRTTCRAHGYPLDEAAAWGGKEAQAGVGFAAETADCGAGLSWRTEARGEDPCYRSSQRTAAPGKGPHWSREQAWGGKEVEGSWCELITTLIFPAPWGDRFGNEGFKLSLG